LDKKQSEVRRLFTNKESSQTAKCLFKFNKNEAQRYTFYFFLCYLPPFIAHFHSVCA